MITGSAFSGCRFKATNAAPMAATNATATTAMRARFIGLLLANEAATMRLFTTVIADKPSMYG